jgi:hypothetical protein
MTRGRKTASAVGGVLLVGGLSVAAFVLLRRFMSLIGTIDSQVGAILLLPFSILFAAMMMASSIRRAATQGTAKQLGSERSAAYRMLVDVWGSRLRQRRDARDQSAMNVSEELQTLDGLVSLYGSAMVIKAHTGLRGLDQNSWMDADARHRFATAVMEIRKDLGSDTDGLSAEDVEQLFFGGSDRARAPVSADGYRALTPHISATSHS